MDNNQGNTVLVVSNDKQLRERISDAITFRKKRFKVSTHSCVETACVDTALTPNGGLILAEYAASDVLNFYFPLALKHVPTVTVSSTKKESDVVSVLMGGSDGFISIDESDRLLAARIDAAFTVHRSVSQRVFSVPPFQFDYIKRQVFKQEKSLGLSPKEFQFAEYVFNRPCRVVKTPDLMASVWSAPFCVDSRSVDTVAYHVRKKMQLGTADAGWDIKRIRSVGFRVLPVSNPKSTTAD